MCYALKNSVLIHIVCCFLQEWQYQPTYLVLVDMEHKDKPYATYIAQENLELHLPPQKIDHPEIDNYFDFYDGSFYHMRGAMKELYPHD